jgi:hypothetical protein
MVDASPFLVAMCEGEHCLPMFAIADQRGDDGGGATVQARLATTLTAVAALLCAKGAVGRLVLLDPETGELIATRQVWP